MKKHLLLALTASLSLQAEGVNIPDILVETPSEDEEQLALEEGAPKKEAKYSRKKYLELTKKHRKMRVLAEDRDKYKLNPEPAEDVEPESQEEDVNDILRSIKGD